MHEILLRVQTFLDSANREAQVITDEVLDEFAASCRDALKRQFTEAPKDKFTIRMSNVGRPLCQLQKEQLGEPRETPGYNHRMKMLIGDMIEAAAVAIMKSAGVDITSQQEKVTLHVPFQDDQNGADVEGTLDVEVNGTEIFDIKSASKWAFNHKFSDYDALAADDSFGYVCQGFGYAVSKGKRFGGWIAINKETGEWAVCQAPTGDAYTAARKQALDTIRNNVQALVDAKPFERCFEDIEETYYRKPTGNRVLPFNCAFCDFKRSCWPDARLMPKRSSKGMNPDLIWYTEINDNKDDETNVS